MQHFPWFKTQTTGWTWLIRLLVGAVVFFPEGLQKLFFADILGTGRFIKIGIPWADFFGPFVGVFETVCGLLIILGLFTRLASIPLIVIMLVAITSTKIPILLGHDLWFFHLPEGIRTGFWAMSHAARNDFCMLLACLYLLITGGGRLSMDHWLDKRQS
ncbi:DoxX family protein [Shewanella surugensis]|uniref:DoxX family protein n=1 Tax=Shewanella surugensis TaxID=212020 RepID=A0ABT0LBR3_9GAMM|nr:DoxX family protein [Shewanella surugensis]MCL1125114.1 DoxX family protein [Shewanella surugensis]